MLFMRKISGDKYSSHMTTGNTVIVVTATQGLCNPFKKRKLVLSM